MNNKKAFLKEIAAISDSKYKNFKKEKHNFVPKFIFQEPEDEQLFDPSYGLVDLLNPDELTAYKSRLSDGFSLLFDDSKQIEIYISQRISKYYDTRRLAKGIMLGSSNPNSSSIQKFLVFKLLDLSINNLDLLPERNVFLGKAKRESREIGVKLNRLGGFALMDHVCNALVPSIDRSELSYCWDGIGDWVN